MRKPYVDKDYVDCGYFVGDCSGKTLPGYVKVVGFSRKKIIKPDEKNTTNDIKRRYNKKFGRKAFAIPTQNIG